MTALKIGVAAVVVIAAGIVAWSTFTTSTARVSATTDADSLFEAGTLTLDRPDDSVSLLLNADGLYPGLEATGCVELAYDGSIPASIRLHGAPAGGTGLEEYVDIVLEQSRPGGSCPSFGPADPVFDGRLAGLWRRHPSYGRGFVMAPDATAGTRLALRASATVIDDNDAQGLATEFVITIEVRP